MQDRYRSVEGVGACDKAGGSRASLTVNEASWTRRWSSHGRRESKSSCVSVRLDGRIM